MFESLSERLSGVFDRLRGRGALTEEDVRGAMREVRIALLEADVALPVVRTFVEQATEKAVGQQVLRSVTPGQQVVKIVHDALVAMLGSDTAELNVQVAPPAVRVSTARRSGSCTSSVAISCGSRYFCGSPSKWPRTRWVMHSRTTGAPPRGRTA